MPEYGDRSPQERTETSGLALTPEEEARFVSYIEKIGTEESNFKNLTPTEADDYRTLVKKMTDFHSRSTN